ncbi:MAG: radical SAM family heme chaperone HemW [Planctomycetota bacterium]|jgi:oxygen-independent coproporphyrinogen-3 oxidase
MPPHPASIYVHVPFCVRKCGYCDFNSYLLEGPEVADRFLSALDLEFRMRPLPDDPVSIFIGGGTPTHLDETRFAAFLEVLGRHLDLAACSEVTMEGNPESVTETKARLAREAGVNRVSIGAQSFKSDYLDFLDRAHDGDQTCQAVAAMRAAGFENLSLDLIFGLPGQSVAEWQQDLELALELSPDHLSCYQLTFEPGTQLTHDLRKGRVQPNDEQADREMFLLTRELLGERGFDAYEISNFAGRGGPCAHNDHYWRQGDYVGLGPGAASHERGLRSTNLKAMEAWAGSLEAGKDPSAEAETLTSRQRAGEAVWLGLRRRSGVNLADAEQRLGLPLQDWFADLIQAEVEAGRLLLEEANLTLSGEGLLFADEVAAKFLSML